jgi:hypothetical protein
MDDAAARRLVHANTAVAWLHFRFPLRERQAHNQ